MKPRLLFLAMVCVLLFGWYQINILPNGPDRDRHQAGSMDRQPAMNFKDSAYHAIGLAQPGVW